MLSHPGAAIYGTITVGALLAAESAKHETYAATVGAVAIVLLVYGLEHAYSEFAEHRLERKQPLTLGGLTQTAVYGLMIIPGAAIPLLALLICWVAGVRLPSAVEAAVWTSAVMIVVVEVVAGVRARLPGRALAAQAAVGAFFGVLVIALEQVLR